MLDRSAYRSQVEHGRLFIAQDGSYQSYDLASFKDNSLSERDVRGANRIIARIGPDSGGAICRALRLASADGTRRAPQRSTPRAQRDEGPGTVAVWSAANIGAEDRNPLTMQ